MADGPANQDESTDDEMMGWAGTWWRGMRDGADAGDGQGRMQVTYMNKEQINASARPSVLEQSSTMMTRSTSADEISKHDFRSLLAEYPAVAEALAGDASSFPFLHFHGPLNH